MLEKLTIPPTDDTPEINFDPNEGVMNFEGRSLPEDVNKFFEPVMKWFDAYLKEPNDKTKLVFNLEYFNTASTRVVHEILQKLDSQLGKGKVEVLWYYETDDEDMLDLGKEFKETLSIPIELIPVEQTI